MLFTFFFILFFFAFRDPAVFGNGSDNGIRFTWRIFFFLYFSSYFIIIMCIYGPAIICHYGRNNCVFESVYVNIEFLFIESLPFFISFFLQFSFFRSPISLKRLVFPLRFSSFSNIYYKPSLILCEHDVLLTIYQCHCLPFEAINACEFAKER